MSEKVCEFGGSVLKYHCILPQEQLCAKNIGLKNVMQDVIGIVNNIHSKALSHCQFKALVDEVDAQYGDILYQWEVRWLSHGKFLRRFFELREEIRVFQATQKNSIQMPSDNHWLCRPGFSSGHHRAAESGGTECLRFEGFSRCHSGGKPMDLTPAFNYVAIPICVFLLYKH